jgi:hypothetical protein
MGFSKSVTTNNYLITNAVGVRQGDFVIDRTEQRHYKFNTTAVLDMRDQRNWSVSYHSDGYAVFLLVERSDADYWLWSFGNFLEPLEPLEPLAPQTNVPDVKDADVMSDVSP